MKTREGGEDTLWKTTDSTCCCRKLNLSMMQLKDWIFLVWGQLYHCVIWRKKNQVNSVIWIQLKLFS